MWPGDDPSMEPFGHLVRQWCASMSFPCLWKCRQLLHETFDVVPANWHPWETSKHLTTGWSLNAIVTWWRSCALLLRWEHRSPRQGFRNLGTHCGPGQICSCLYIRLGYHKIVWRHQFWDENFFSSKKDREYFHQISSFRRMEIETEFSRMKWFTGINSLLQIWRPQFMLNMISVTFALYHFCSHFRIIAGPASAPEKNDGVPGSCRPPGGVKIPPPSANVSTTLKNTT